jgi:DNA-binding response OmpR family regulator
MNPDSARVLLVDDDASIRTFLSLLCRREGWTVEALADGADVSERLHSFKPDVIVLDLMMPGVSGFDVMDELRADDPTMLRSVIVLTAVSTTVLRSLTHESELWKVVRKPFDMYELIATIRACAEAHRPGCAMGQMEETRRPRHVTMRAE